ncbi:pilus assembly protein TadB [Dermabacter hominis 1368]|uniref:Pilus assembly protein TadB n=1 Tax=Dermabacter hominis 1368 TaxID=1450519 RepID=A0ABR4SJW9_9MICO|nr:type II secretion system F family protein [Dermabacter sp.]KDS93499.1 pilus assembly protein TadB [Dermabacter hominis 1368]MDU4922857.1 type II secretion system F family protein [Dermabacter sp.]
MIIRDNTLTIVILGCTLGALFGLGLALVILENPWRRPRSVEARVSPYIKRGSARGALDFLENSARVHPLIDASVGPFLESVRAFAARALGSQREIEKRLALAGGRITYRDFRIQQFTWAIVAFVASAALGMGLFALERAPLIALLALVVIASVTAPLVRDYLLTSAISSRKQAMAREFPTIADLLALAISAGEGPIAAMERVARTSQGELSRELAIAVSEIRAGASLEDALINLGTRSPLDSLSRFAETIAVALERGTPLADVMRAQAQDARELSKRTLMESAGRREVYMLLPVVFLLMPLVIVFAVFPGITALQVGL